MFSRHFFCRNLALSGSDFNYLLSVCINNARNFCQNVFGGRTYFVLSTDHGRISAWVVPELIESALVSLRIPGH